MRVGFILNHYDLHQVPHIVPFAFALSLKHGDTDCVVLSSSKDQEDFAREIGAVFPGHRVRFERLRVPSLIRAVDPLVSKVAFIRKTAVLRANAARLRGFDALVVPEMTSLALRKLPGFETVKLIFTGHGAGDNRLGGSFDPRIGQFDLALMPGRKYANALQEMGYLPAEKSVLVGYPKIETMMKLGGGRPGLFANARPTVLYNPHHNASLSSWHRMGARVLDFFYRSTDYNLIFAPHVLLFKRAWSRGARFPASYRSTETVRIDLGSRDSVDMSYAMAADLYLGDVSSQVYEFIARPRPCVFLNAHRTNPEGDPSYDHWRFGPVIDDPSGLEAALRLAIDSFPEREPIQRAAFEQTFESGPEGAAARGASAIHAFVRSGRL
jgi:hypothetical protein